MQIKEKYIKNIGYDLAPIVLFVYNRLDHTIRTIEALKKNELAHNSRLIIYADAPKHVSDNHDVLSVRNYIKSIDGFKKVTIFERKENWGLANSIIDGVTKIVNEYGKIIVLEDDLVTSPYFLKFMNDALKVYEENKRIWEVGGYIYPTSYESKRDFFFAPYITSWGWATWKDRWKYFERDAKKLINIFNKKKIKKFNLDNSDNNLWVQVIKNAEGKLHTWAVFWYATVFLNNGLTIYPKRSMVQNIGHDGSGMNCGKSDLFRVNLAEKPLNILLVDVGSDENSLAEVKKYFKKNRSISKRILAKIRRWFF
jgi:hypothetical protein